MAFEKHSQNFEAPSQTPTPLLVANVSPTPPLLNKEAAGGVNGKFGNVKVLVEIKCYAELLAFAQASSKRQNTGIVPAFDLSLLDCMLV